jgi:[acyl-carrier-protein] S-malonyltransferase
MAASPAAKAIFDRADALLAGHFDAPLSRLCVEGPADLINRTDVSQPAIYVCSVACWHGLHHNADAPGGDTPTPAAAGGLSLGEYTALHLAGVFSFEDGLRLVTERGRLMQQAAEASDGSMLAVMGLAQEDAQAFCDDVLASMGGSATGVLVPANLNAPGQIVLSGDTAACAQAAQACEAQSLRATPLSVAGAFHSQHMHPAAQGLAKVLADVDVQSPACDVWSNVTAERHQNDAASIRQRLVDQLTSPVRWADQAAAMVGAGHTQFTELAPGRVLRGLLRRIDRTAKVQSHDEPDTTPVS